MTAEGEKGGGAFEGEGRSSAVLCLAKDDCVGARYCVPCTAMPLEKKRKGKSTRFGISFIDKPSVVRSCSVYIGPCRKCKLQLVLCRLHCGC